MAGRSPVVVLEETLIGLKLEKIKLQYFDRGIHDVDLLVAQLDDITKRRYEIYDDYVRKRLLANAECRALTMPKADAYRPVKVKKVDLQTNRDDSRQEAEYKLTDQDLTRLAKYDFYLNLLNDECHDIVARFDP